MHALLVFVALLLAGCASGPVDLLREASGSVSQTLCSKTFVSGLDPETAFREHLRPEPGMGLVAWAMHYEVDRDRREVRTRIGGSFERRSVFRAGRGCTLVYPEETTPVVPLSAAAPEVQPSEPVVETANAGLHAALDAAFAEPDDGMPRLTKAVVIAHRGRIVAERYAAGYSPDTPLLSHSVAKSVVNALVGILARMGKLSVTQPAPIAGWKDTSITIDNLLRMNAGFGFDEGGGASIATNIWFNQPDTAAASARARRRDPVGARWGYSSRSYTLLSRIVGDAVGGGPQGLRDFAERELFGPLGMRSVTLEFDAHGTLMGANAMFASPRDWAKFGQLYLDDGRVGDRRILPEGWAAYSSRPTGDTGYGAGFWLNNTQAQIPEWGMNWGIPGAPSDAYTARGYMGQYVVIVPSAELVVVRFGVSHGPGASMESVGRLVRESIDSLRGAHSTRNE